MEIPLKEMPLKEMPLKTVMLLTLDLHPKTGLPLRMEFRMPLTMGLPQMIGKQMPLTMLLLLRTKLPLRMEK
jgi:hypothetical protein